MLGTFKEIMAVVVLGFVLSAGNALATCRQYTNEEVATLSALPHPNVDAFSRLIPFNIVFPGARVDVSPDLAIGDTLTTGVSSALGPKTSFLTCNNAGGMALWRYVTSHAATAIAGVVETGVAGIGMRLRFVRPDGRATTFPFDSTFVPYPGPIRPALESGTYFALDLVKTGEMATSSTIAPGALATGSGDGDGVTVVQIGAGSVNVNVMPSCSVNSASQNVNFGTFGPGEVSTISGPTRPVTFQVRCTGPTPPQSIVGSLTGTPDTANPAYIRNLGAQNLAIRLRDVATGTVLRPGNPASTIVATGGGRLYDYSLEATVLRVGTEAPTAGQINATGVIVLQVN